MRTGFKTKKVIGSAGDAGVDDTVADPTGRRGDARRGIAELTDVTVNGVYPSTAKARETGRWFLISNVPWRDWRRRRH